MVLAFRGSKTFRIHVELYPTNNDDIRHGKVSIVFQLVHKLIHNN